MTSYLTTTIHFPGRSTAAARPTPIALLPDHTWWTLCWHCGDIVVTVMVMKIMATMWCDIMMMICSQTTPGRHCSDGDGHENHGNHVMWWWCGWWWREKYLRKVAIRDFHHGSWWWQQWQQLWLGCCEMETVIVFKYTICVKWPAGVSIGGSLL